MEWKKLSLSAVLIVNVLLSSCSATWHLERAVKKNPRILEKDTLVVMDTVVTPPVAITDTVILRQHDTITLIKDRLRVQIRRINDTITIDAICDSDTIVSVVEVPYEKIVYVPRETTKQTIQKWGLYLLLGFVGLQVLKRLFKE